MFKNTLDYHGYEFPAGIIICDLCKKELNINELDTTGIGDIFCHNCEEWRFANEWCNISELGIK